MESLVAPLRFRRHEVPKPWGGRGLQRTPGLTLTSPEPIGETWEVVDRPGENSLVQDGPHGGRSLRELMQDHARDVLGKAPATHHGRFPVLVKYIDAQRNLSVQVHPDDEGAARLGGEAEAKTEAWYILDVQRDPDAPEPKLGRIYAGLRAGVTREAFAEVASSRGVLACLEAWEVRPGQCLVVPGGTVHAIGAGITLLEVQQNSDTTYRLWDWDRVGPDGAARETHRDPGLEATRFDLPRRPPIDPVWTPAGEGAELAHLTRSATFGMNLLRVHGATRRSTQNQFQIYAAVEGTGTLSVPAADTSVPLERGDVWLVPAAAGYHHLEPTYGPLTLVQSLWRP